MTSNIGEPLRLVIIGKTGVGKSHVGNIILGREEFDSRPSASSVTQVCQKAEVAGDRRIEVIDTPGILDTDREPEVVAKAILRSIYMSSPGPHAFLLVLQVGRFTKEEQNAVRALQEIFGEDVAKYMIVVFNRAQELKKQHLDCYVKSGEKLLDVVNECGKRYVPIDNNLDNRTQVADLVGQVNKMIVLNGGNYFSNDVYEQSKKEDNADSFITKMLGKMIAWVQNYFQALFK